MGFEYVKQLADRGYNVIIAALYQKETDAVKAAMESAHPELDFVSIGIDLARTEAAQELFDAIQRERPGAEVEVLINNAGIIHPMRFRKMSREQLSKILLLHNYTLTQLCSLYLPQMLERKKGYILNVSSLGAWFPYSLLTTYSSTKAYTKVFTNALRMECRGTGVNVATIFFGAVDTPLLPLSDKIRKWAKRLHVMITPDRAVRIALKMLFKGRSGRMPGFMNRFFNVIIRPILPKSFIAWAINTIERNFFPKTPTP